MRQPATVPNSENDEFKKNLAAMLLRGQNTQAKKPEAVVEESKEKIKLSMFEDDDGDEEDRMKKMLDKQSNLASEETAIKMAIPAPQKQRRMSSLRSKDSFEDF
jgi:hypothetical protein